MTTVDEIWKPVKGFPNYEISNIGNCRSKDHVTIRERIHRGQKEATPIPYKGRILKKRYTNGYVRYLIYNGGRKNKKQIKAHRAVYEAFVGPIPEGLTINHKNGIKDDNWVENLETMTISENSRHAVNTGLTHVVLNETLVEKMRIAYATGNFTHKDLATKHGVKERTVKAAVTGQNWKHVGGPITPPKSRKQKASKQ